MKKVFWLYIFCLVTSECGAQVDKRPLTISPLTNNFYVYLSYGHYDGQDYPANGMYLVTKEGVILFDTPWDETYYQPLLDSIWKRHHKKVVMCISTHFHSDRTGGLKYFRTKGIKTYATKLTDSLCVVHHENRAQFLIFNDTTFNVGGYSFKTYYGGPGHSQDNIVIWVPKYKILYGGCFIKSTPDKDLGNLADASIKEWAGSIHRVQHRFPNPRYIIAGHNDYTDTNSITHTLDLINRYNSKHPD